MDKLFVLIKSLSKNEKGYFKKFVSKHTDADRNIYVNLFKTIENQRQYDEKTVKQRMLKHGRMPELSVYKNYLYQVILKSLRSYHNEVSIDSKLHEMLKDAEILYKKTLYSDCESVLHKALKLAEKYEKHIFLLYIYSRLFKLMIVLEDDNQKFHKFCHQYYDRQCEILEEYKKITDYRMLSAKLRYLHRDVSTLKNTYPEDELRELMRSPLLQDGIAIHSYRAGLNYYNTLGRIYSTELNDAEKGYYYNKKYVEFVEANPAHLEEEIEHYTSALNNLMLDLIALKKHDEFHVCLKKLQGISVKFPDWQARVLEKEWNIRLVYFIKTGKIKEGLQFVKDHREAFNRLDRPMAEGMKIAILDSISILYFMSGDYSESLKWVNRILLGKWSAEKRMQCFSRLLFLLIHYEKGNFDVVENSFPRISKHILEYVGKGNREELVLHFIRESVSLHHDTRDYKKKLKELHSRLSKKETKTGPISIFDCFDPLLWTESRIKQVNMMALLPVTE